jgi:hypothetical protein
MYYLGRPARPAHEIAFAAEREIPSASHGRCAGRLGMIPCALRQRSEHNRAFSRRSAAVMTLLSSRYGSAGTKSHTKRIRVSTFTALPFKEKPGEAKRGARRPSIFRDRGGVSQTDFSLSAHRTLHAEGHELFPEVATGTPIGLKPRSPSADR